MFLKRNASDRKRYRRTRMLLIVCILSAIGISVALRVSVFTRAEQNEDASRPVQAGMLAPDVSLMSVHGDVFHLAEHTRQIVVLAFLQTQPDTASTASRSQAVFLTSIEQQYGSKGIHVAFIDASMLETGQQATHNDLLNVTYDWNMGTIPLLEDSDGSVTRHYGVRHTPALFIVGARSRVEQAWQGLTSTAQIALTLQKLSGSLSAITSARTLSRTL